MSDLFVGPSPLLRTLLGIVLLRGTLLACAAPEAAHAQANEAGHPWIETYAADTYGNWRGDLTVGHRQNWGVTQGPDGVIYVANQEGLLSYDGAHWSALPVADEAPRSGEGDDRRRNVFSVGRLPKGHPDAGRILVGGEGTFGVLRPDSVGRLAFASLRPHLPPDERERVGTVHSVAGTARAAYFRTDRRLYRWAGDSLHVWSAAAVASAAEPSFAATASVHDTLYVQVQGSGLFRVDGNRLRPVPGGERLAEATVSVLLPFEGAAPNGVLVGTRAGDLFRVSATGVAALTWPVESWLRTHTLSGGARLPDGSYAFATRRGGLLHATAEGARRHVLDTEVGLQTNLVQHVFVDRAGSLWLALGDGVARVDASAPFTYYDAPLGLAAGVDAIARHEGVLYGCTRNGLHRLNTPAGTFARLGSVGGLDVACSGLASTPHGLLVATDAGTWVHRPGQAPYRVNKGAVASEATGLVRGEAGVAYVGVADGGVRRLRVEDRRWAVDPSFPTDRLGLHDLPVQDLARAGDGTLWAAGPNGVARITAPATPSATGTRYGTDDGLPVTPALRVFSVHGTVYFGSQQGLHRFEATGTRTGRFVPDSTFGAEWAQPGAYVTHLLGTGNGAVWGRAMRTPPDGRNVIFTLYRGPGGTEMRNSRPFVPFRDMIRGPVHVEDAVVWLGRRGLAPLSRLDFSRLLQTAGDAANPSVHATRLGPRPAPQIRRVTVGVRDSVVYGGPTSTSPIRLDANRGALHVRYALPRYVLAATPVEYRTRLGTHQRWSAWSREASVDYAPLSPGHYQLQVQVRLPGEPPGEVTSLGVRVVPPWYRTTWALALWGLLGLGLIVGLCAVGVRWRTRRLEQRRQRLEDTVTTRTRQVQRQNERLSEQADQLAEQAERLREVDRLKSRFFTNVSHEFRTPLTLTIGPLEDVVEGETALPDWVREKVDLALRNSRRLLRLIGQLLDTAKLEAGELTLDTGSADLAAFTRTLARSFAPLAERRRVRYVVEAPDAPVRLRFDPDKMEKVLTNLLSNAFKFTPKGGTIRVVVALADDTATVTVQDSGPGIPEEEQAHLFERFYQTEQPRSEVQSGSGVGLSLAKDLAELHGGTIRVESTKGQGSAFIVHLPRDTSSSAPGTTAPSSATILAPGPGPNGDGAQPAPDAADPTPPEDDRPTLLIADDNAEIRAYVRSHFDSDYRVLEAADGRAALDTARTALPDLIISDVMMPHLDGVALVEALRADPETDFLPVLLLTARADEDDKIEGLSEGADAYLTKPFNIRELQVRVDNLIASRKRLKERFSADPPEAPVPFDDPDDLSPSETDYLDRVQTVIEQHLSDDAFGVEELANALGQSRSTLYRRLRALVDRSPTDVIREVRLARAAALLREGRGTVSEVAYAVGFKSVSHFSKTFREAHDVVPSAYADEVPESP